MKMSQHSLLIFLLLSATYTCYILPKVVFVLWQGPSLLYVSFGKKKGNFEDRYTRKGLSKSVKFHQGACMLSYRETVWTMIPLWFLPPANVVCEGYIFTGVCDSVNRGGVHGCLGGHVWLLPGGCAWLLLGGCAWLLPGGVCGFCQGVCMVFTGVCVVFARGCAWFLPGGGMCRIRRDTVNERAVRILLECILVMLLSSAKYCFIFTGSVN